MSRDASRLLRVLQEMAAEKGYAVGVAPAEPSPTGEKLDGWLAEGKAGTMEWMAKAPARRKDPREVVPGAKSVVAFAASYRGDAPPPESVLRAELRGRVARYAWGRDYHDVLTPELRRIMAEVDPANRTYVDTGPVLERDTAVRAGLGFAAKSTNLIRPGEGSFVFLGAGITTRELPPTPSGERPGCGSCRICLDDCPTGAIVAPHVVDARLCISYLTIELRGPIPRELRPKVGLWLFGCDVCQDVCPWNAGGGTPAREELRAKSIDDQAPSLLDLLALDDEGFRTRFKGTPLLRPKRRGILRNACVVLGNLGDPRAIPALTAALSDPEPLVRGHAAWALGRLGAKRELEQRHDPDPWVEQEIRLALC